jgi:hypothetical protein
MHPAAVLKFAALIAVQKSQCCLKIARGGGSVRQQACPIRFMPENTKRKGRRVMAKKDFGYLPRENPCAQCGKPIATPEWTENGPRRISFLWHCQACDYRFEAVAFFDASHKDREAIAA